MGVKEREPRTNYPSVQNERIRPTITFAETALYTLKGITKPWLTPGEGENQATHNQSPSFVFRE